MWQRVGIGCVSSAAVMAGCPSSTDGAAMDESTSGSNVTTGRTTETTPNETTTGTSVDGCGVNLLVDSGFEGGTPNASWNEVSPLFGTPICNAECTSDAGAAPFVGDWWVWFGGVAMTDTPAVRQSVIIPEGEALLRFAFSINTGAGTGNDVFTVSLDDDPLLLVADTEVADYGGWRIVELDVSSYADGAEHSVGFSATIAGVGLTNFFVDEVALLSCPSGGSGSSSTGPTSSDGASTGGTGGSSG